MEELDLKELFTLFWNKRAKIFLIVLIFAIIGVIYTIGFVTPVYTSSTTLVLATQEDSAKSNTITTTDLTLNSKLVSTYSELVKSKNVIRQVISNLNLHVSENSIKKNVSVSSVKDTELIQISVTNESPVEAAKIANEIAKVFSDKVAEIYNINNIHVVDEAEVMNSPSNINHIKDVVIFTFIGAVVAIAYVLVANMLDTTVKSAEELEKDFQIPVLASVPMYDYEMSRKGGKKK